MKRSVLTSLIRVAGYHEDTAAFTRLRIENRISPEKASRAYREGQRAREIGVRCECRECGQRK